MTGIITYTIYYHLDQQQLLSEEQKGCRKCQGVPINHCVASAAIREFEFRKKKFAMAWIYYKKTYMVLYPWAAECLDMFGEAEKIKLLLFNNMEKLIVICAGNL